MFKYGKRKISNGRYSRRRKHEQYDFSSWLAKDENIAELGNTLGLTLTDVETERMESFLEDFHSLSETPEIRQIVSDTEDYKNSIEDAWRNFEHHLIDHIKSILGYEPDKVGNVNTYILYPTHDVRYRLY